MASDGALARTMGARRFGYVDELNAPFFFPAGALIDDGGASWRAPDLFRITALGERTASAGGAGWELSARIAPRGDSESPAHIARKSLRIPAADGGEAFLSLREHPGRLFGFFRREDGPASFDRHHRLAAPWVGFAAGGIGAGGAARMPSGGRIAFGVFSGGAMFSGDHTPAGESNLAALIEATSRSGSFSF